MGLTDDRGLTLSTRSPEAAAHFNAAIRDYLEYRLSAGEKLKEALAADPQFALAHCLKGYFMLLVGSTSMHPKAEQALRAAEACLPGATAREAAHIVALATWLRGDTDGTRRIWEQIFLDHPTDILALRLHQFAVFWMGHADLLLAGPAGVLDAWAPDLPGYGNVLGMLAFGLEENGAYAEAETHGRAAVELNPDDLWAVHAVAHVLEMQGRHADGRVWFDRPLDIWEDRNPFKDHLWWHAALFPLEMGDFDRVLELYDARIRVSEQAFYLDVQNAASMLMRLEFLGVDVGARWGKLADIAETRLADHVLPFTDMHWAMVLSHEGRAEAAERFIASLEGFADNPHATAARVVRPLLIPISRALLAYGRGDFDEAVDLLLPLRHELTPIGGSHAQRDIVQQLLLVAALRAGRERIVRMLISERRVSHPSSRLLRDESLGLWRRSETLPKRQAVG